ncbi:hypothetical protein TYRP_013325 [Tyrophagus putrescentiae]|nr:hypothetical protein TYRP_013325 [Tyrophagus putrescentiae]
MLLTELLQVAALWSPFLPVELQLSSRSFLIMALYEKRRTSIGTRKVRRKLAAMKSRLFVPPKSTLYEHS